MNIFGTAISEAPMRPTFPSCVAYVLNLVAPSQIEEERTVCGEKPRFEAIPHARSVYAT
jgi:hypothetical protein